VLHLAIPVQLQYAQVFLPTDETWRQVPLWYIRVSACLPCTTCAETVSTATT